MTARSPQHISPSARLQRACEHVNRMWLPINPAVYQSIQRGLAEGRYQLSLEFLLQDLTQDISLYLYCLRELSAHITDRGESFSFDNPLSLFKAAGLENIKKTFSVPGETISTHTFSGEMSPQIRRLEAVLISSTTATVLAERDERDAEPIRLTAILRQLGHLLIAWNYPSVYLRAVVKKNASLDQTLNDSLGFSPLTLAHALVSSWAINPRVRFAAYGEAGLSPQEQGSAAELKEQSDYLKKLCEIGEALARANDPATYPTAAHDWRSAQKLLHDGLGDNALNTLNEKLKENSAAYRALMPQALGKDTPFDPEGNLHRLPKEASVLRRPLTAPLDESLKNGLENLYLALAHGSSTAECLDTLVKRVIPLTSLAGFIVYTYEPHDHQLIPRLKTGNIRMRSLRPVRGVENSERPDAVAMAWECAAPISSPGHSGEFSYIAASLGTERKAGVLYAEYLLSTENAAERAPQEFRAIRQALADCLRLA